MNKFILTTVALAIGAGLGYYGATLTQVIESPTQSSSNKAPLYWVAPMDPNYQRDKPGKSPMGMDLIPVYDDASTSKVAGTVTISPEVENNLGVEVTPVVEAPLMPVIDTVGYVGFDESTLWQINTRISGWIEQLFISTVGQEVKQGDVLFTLYSPELVKAQEEFLNAIRSGRNRLINGAEERLLSLGVDKTQIKQLQRSGKALRQIAIKAPRDGVIATLNVRQGGYLNPAQTVVTAGSLDKVWVDVEVFDRQSPWIKTGTAAEMMIPSLPSQHWKGVVDYIYPIINAQTRTQRVRLIFDNSDGNLKPNMFANIALKPIDDRVVIQVPNQAVIRSGKMSRVVLATSDGYRSVRIETGREAGDMIEVTSGLSKTDKIVTSAHFMLDSESSITADFSRINRPEKDMLAKTVWIEGRINAVHVNDRKLTIYHEPVDAWQWPAMTMDFVVTEQIKLTDVNNDDAIRFELHKNKHGQYEILQLEVTQKAQSSTWGEGKITNITADSRSLTISHQAIDNLGWPAMTMNFVLSQGVNISTLQPQQLVDFELVKNDHGQYEIQTIALAKASKGDAL